VDKVPSYFITGGNQLNFAVMTKAANVSNDVMSTADLALLGQALVSDIIAQGEDAADAEAILASGTTWIGNYNGVLYAFMDTQAGVFVYKQTCGAMAQLPYIIGGAALLGIGGFAYGYSRKGKGKKKGIPAYALMGATVGVLAGAGGGYLLSKLATDAFTKSASQMGAVPHKAYRWQFLTDGEFGSMEGGNMGNWTKVRMRPHLPKTPNPVLFHVRGNKTGYYYALADEYAYLLLRWNGSAWVRVKA